MSNLSDDIARGCLPNGEPLEAKYGVGYWSDPLSSREPEPDFYGAECPFCHKESYWVEYCGHHEFVKCLKCGKKTKDLIKEIKEEVLNKNDSSKNLV
jgi:Zn ribbon nucleic-acid-binding protein